MPGMGGEVFIRTIRDPGGESDLAIVAVSAGLSPDEERTLETVGVREEGAEFPLSMNLSTITDSEGRPVGVSCILMDLTEKKRIMEILVQSEKLAEIGRLGSGIVHEIKNPLTSIMMMSDIITATSGLPEKTLRYAEMVARVARGLDHRLGHRAGDSIAWPPVAHRPEGRCVAPL